MPALALDSPAALVGRTFLPELCSVQQSIFFHDHPRFSPFHFQKFYRFLRANRGAPTKRPKVFTDVRISGSMDGLELASVAKRKRSQLVVIVTSG